MPRGARLDATGILHHVADFRPAKPRRWLISLAANLNRILLARNTTLEIRPEDIHLLRTLPPSCLIAPNHAHYSDPQVIFEIARRAGRRVVFMTTREAFDKWGGLAGWFLQHLGAFSVNRGGTNEEGRQFALEILVRGTFDLAMFPEGEIYLLNDLVMPLKPGAARLALEAALELQRAGRPRPILVVPVAIKYRFSGDVQPALEATTARLESQVLGGPRTGPLYPRIAALGEVLLSRAEEEHGVKPDPESDLYARVRHLRHILLERLERRHLGRVLDGFDFDRARKLMIRIQGLRLQGRGRGGYYGSPAARPDDPLARDLRAAGLCARSVAFQDDYLLENPTQERMAETLLKLEREVLGKEIRTPLGRRRAIVRIAPPIDVQEFFSGDAVTADLDEVIEGLVTRLHSTLQSTLDAISREDSETP